MKFEVFKIAKIRDQDEIEDILSTFDVSSIEDLQKYPDKLEVMDFLAEEYHVQDLEEYSSFEIDQDEFDTGEIGDKVDEDCEDEGYSLEFDDNLIAIYYYKRIDYV